MRSSLSLEEIRSKIEKKLKQRVAARVDAGGADVQDFVEGSVDSGVPGAGDVDQNNYCMGLVNCLLIVVGCAFESPLWKLAHSRAAKENTHFVPASVHFNFSIIALIGTAIYLKFAATYDCWRGVRNISIINHIKFGALRVIAKISNLLFALSLQYLSVGLVMTLAFTRITIIMGLRSLYYRQTPSLHQLVVALIIIIFAIAYGMVYRTNNEEKSDGKKQFLLGFILMMSRTILRSISDVLTESLLRNDQFKTICPMTKYLMAGPGDILGTLILWLLTPAYESMSNWYIPFAGWNIFTWLLLPAMFSVIGPQILNVSYWTNPSEINAIANYIGNLASVMIAVAVGSEKLDWSLMLLFVGIVLVNVDYQIVNFKETVEKETEKIAAKSIFNDEPE